MLRNFILLPILLLTLFCLTCISVEQEQPPEQVNAILNNMQAYLNAHPSLADKYGNPSQTFQDIFNQVKEQGEQQAAAVAKPASVPAVAQQAPAPAVVQPNTANIDLSSASKPNAANVDLSSASKPNAANVDLSKNVANRATVPADIPIALAAGVPASVAAAAAIPPNHGVVNAPAAAAISPAVAPPAPVVPAVAPPAPVVPAVAPPAPVVPAVAPPAPVVPAVAPPAPVAPAIAPPAPFVPAVVPPAVAEPAKKEDKGISVASAPINNKNAAANSVEPHIEAPSVVPASIVPITTIAQPSVAPEPSFSIYPPPSTVITSDSGSASPTSVNTHTIVSSTTAVSSSHMNATSSRSSSSFSTRSATPSATSIPPIAGKASALSVDSNGFAAIIFISTFITMIYL